MARVITCDVRTRRTWGFRVALAPLAAIVATPLWFDAIAASRLVLLLLAAVGTGGMIVGLSWRATRNVSVRVDLAGIALGRGVFLERSRLCGAGVVPAENRLVQVNLVQRALGAELVAHQIIAKSEGEARSLVTAAALDPVRASRGFR